MKKKLFIFSNESISVEDNKFYCDNLDLKSTPEGLNKKFEVNLLGRKSIKKRSHEIKIKRIKVFGNIFSYLSEVIKASKNKDSKFLIISISPYTFLISLFIKILGQKPIVYLRSDGYGEYKAILGKIGPIIYHIMFSIVSTFSNLISCRDYILRGKKGKIIIISPTLPKIPPKSLIMTVILANQVRNQRGVVSRNHSRKRYYRHF